MRQDISRRSFIGLAGIVALGLVGCGNARNASSASEPEQTSEPTEKKSEEPKVTESTPADDTKAASAGKSLIVLWSWSGNTLKMAERLSKLSGAEIYRLEATDAYPEDYDACVERAKRERDDKVYPEIKNALSGWEDYDTVYVGYPIWWYEMPMVLQGFVKDHDWKGKTVIPFNSHEGSGDGGTYETLHEMTGATVREGLAIRGGEVATSLDKVDAWHKSLTK